LAATVWICKSTQYKKAQLVPQSTCDPITLTATSDFAPQTDKYLIDNGRYDPYLHRCMLNKQHKGNAVVDMTGTIRKGLLGSLQYNPEEKGQDIGSRITGRC
jgi:hypothetical protein